MDLVCSVMGYTAFMSDEITVDSEILISSKRASILSGYEQDYIGQLCRGGNIKARRVGGLWYVSADSLMKYKERASEYKPEPPVRNSEMNTPDSLVSFDGKGHISTSRAAKITGYSPDYVGQMARAQIIPSRQVGNRWYVEHAGILKHKESKDALLGAVQVESVGLKAPEVHRAGGDNAFSTPLYQYTRDNRELLPSTGESADLVARPESADRLQVPTPTLSARLQVPMPTPSAFVARPADAHLIGRPITAANEEAVQKEEVKEEEEYVIPIRVQHVGGTRDARKGSSFLRSDLETPLRSDLGGVLLEPRRTMLPMLLPVGLLTVVIVLSVGLVSLRKSSVYTSNSTWEAGKAAQLASAATSIIGRIGDFLEVLLVPELV